MLVTEKVPCRVCNKTGKLPRLWFWTKDCGVCDGTGERRIIMDAAFPEHVKSQLRFDATYGARFADLVGATLVEREERRDDAD